MTRIVKLLHSDTRPQCCVRHEGRQSDWFKCWCQAGMCHGSVLFYSCHRESKKLLRRRRRQRRLKNEFIFYLRISGYINNSLHLARKYARMFVRGHYLFREANSFPRAYCELRGTDNVQGQISEHIFAPNGDYCLYYPSNLLSNARSLKIGVYSRISPSFSWGIFRHVMCLDQSRASERI